MTLATIVDVSDLVEVVWTAALAGVAVPVAYGTALLGIDRAVEYGREDRSRAAAAYAVLAVVAGAVVAAALVFAFFVMLDN